MTTIPVEADRSERRPHALARWAELPEREPVGATCEGIDLVIVRRGEEHSVLYGRCLHRGALLEDGTVVGDNLLCGLHGWDYRIDTGVSAYDNSEALERFTSWVDDGTVWVDAAEVAGFAHRHPQPQRNPSSHRHPAGAHPRAALPHAAAFAPNDCQRRAPERAQRARGRLSHCGGH